MRVAVIGLGEAGFGLHLRALQGLDGASVVAAVDPDGVRGGAHRVHPLWLTNAG